MKNLLYIPFLLVLGACVAEVDTSSSSSDNSISSNSSISASSVSNNPSSSSSVAVVGSSSVAPLSSSSVAPLSSSSVTSSSAPVVEQTAAELFNQKTCAACHAGGAQLPNFTALVQRDGVEQKIADTMPPNNPGACIGDCARVLAEYMEAQFYVPPSTSELQKAKVPVASYVRKAKSLLTGAVVTEAELSAVKENPDAFADLIREWQKTPGYTQKTRWFLEENLQLHRNIEGGNYVGQIRGTNKANPPTKFVNPKMFQNGQESAIKTVMDLIVKPNKPFNNVATQTEWMLTPAMMAQLLVFDYPNDPAKLDFKIGSNLSAAEKNYTLTQRINTRRFYFPLPSGKDGFRQQNGSTTTLVTKKELGFVWGALNQFSNETSSDAHRLIKPSDYTTWKRVKIRKATRNNQPLRFWDMPAIRNADTLYLNAERVGLFSHPNFLERWETNEDNQFRLTINQTLIAMLNKSFAPDDVSITINEEVLSAEHAAPGTDCYGCHRLVDPMRNYFRNNFDDTHGKPRATIDNQPASFSFGGEVEEGSSLMDLGRVIANHPDFAPAWVQKLCFWSNSQNCVESDPEFKRVATSFKDSDFNFNELMVTFYSSDLIKMDIEERSERAKPAFGSISRYQHVCQLLERRFSDLAGSRVNPCNESAGGVSTLSETIPADEWTRGALAPATPTLPNMFSTTTMENMCRNIALNHYGSKTFPVSAIGAFLDDYLLPSILGVPRGDAIRAGVRKVLVDHYRAVKNANGVNTSEKDALVSVFTLGCSSPLLSSVDF